MLGMTPVVSWRLPKYKKQTNKQKKNIQKRGKLTALGTFLVGLITSST